MISHILNICYNGSNVSLPDVLTSLQVPLTRTFPSGQVHLAPVGLSRHIKSQDILKHGLDALERKSKKANKNRI